MPRFDTMRRCALPALAVLLLLRAAGPAAAQDNFPRVGLSAAAGSWVDSLTVALGDTFTLYVSVLGHTPGEPLAQPLHDVAWVIHQACCGATLDVLATDLNPDLDHTGLSPLSGMVSTAAGCIDQDAIRLATLTVRLRAEGPGQYLVAAGPYAWAHDCEGGEPVFMDMPVLVTATGTSTPAAPGSWSGLKAQYR